MFCNDADSCSEPDNIDAATIFAPGQRLVVNKKLIAMREHASLSEKKSRVIANLQEGTDVKVRTGIVYQEDGRLRVEVVTQDNMQGWVSLKTKSMRTLLVEDPDEV